MIFKMNNGTENKNDYMMKEDGLFKEILETKLN